MSQIDEEVLLEAKERAEDLQGRIETFVDIASGVNHAADCRITEERGYDIEKVHGVTLEDLPLGEERIRVEGTAVGVDAALDSIDDLLSGSVPQEEQQRVWEIVQTSLERAESTLDDCREEEVIKQYGDQQEAEFWESSEDEYENDDEEEDDFR
ncbi:hypothetical protein AB6I73_003956 [Citrobacter amalonaticus]|nr:hypothetical protein [Citrobacter amalonaticus]